ncbi:PucR family transcriptional regulator [Amycolatopsis sp. H20-H5]|uniref:PucR family transcriptional regulator n=1 Tax=Amycolatopsis sp. H20-H5 TaxID=3046309 RepID=UPI002DB6A8B2|nr:helix-turn-helix domain-containing protein [Amycolatopsis sp. H20-H5]MEC3980741.1 helix-turn-helix domain-containing protein [Amycolatopsis sp. H20-H5]
MDAESAGSAAPSVVAALLPRMGEIGAAMIARCVTEIPAYGLLPASVLQGDLVANATAVFELFLTTVAEDRPPTEEELALPIAWGAERARDGLPLDAVLKIYPLAAREAWLLVSEAGSEGLAGLVARMIDFLGEVMPRIAAAYLREREDLDWEQREHRQNLAGSLLAGRPARRVAERYGRTLAERYDVVVFHLPPHPADTSTRATTDLFRAIQSGMDTSPEVLTTVKGDGGVLLVPSPEDGRAPLRVAELLTRIDTAARLSCTAGAATAGTHAGIPDACAEATEVLALAENLHRAPGVYWLCDLAIEYQLAQPSPARTALARILDPLEEHPHLIDALRSFVATGYNRGEAATALTIHRNTLTYRLGRVQLLTGYDATRPADARRLAAAMTAYDIIRSPG